MGNPKDHVGPRPTAPPPPPPPSNGAVGRLDSGGSLVTYVSMFEQLCRAHRELWNGQPDASGTHMIGTLALGRIELALAGLVTSELDSMKPAEQS